MNQAEYAPSAAPNTPQTQPGEPEGPITGSGTSAFAVLVAMGFAVMATFFVLSLVAVWRRSETGTAAPALVATTMVVTGNAVPSAVPTVSEEWRKGTVNVPPDMKNGVLRVMPGFKMALAAFVPHGTVVDVGRATTKDGQRWYRVRAVVNGGTYEGWMHSDIVHMNDVKFE